MKKELMINLERINPETYLNPDENSVDNVISTHDSNKEIFLMNYDDIIREDEAELSFPVEIECKEEPCDIEIDHNELQETVIVKKELNVEEEELCDVIKREEILQTFEVNNGTDAKKEEESDEEEQSDSDKKKKLICYQCGFRAEKKHHLSMHIQFAHKKGTAVKKEFACEYCMFTTKYKTSLTVHIGRFHLNEIKKDGSGNTYQKKSCYDVQRPDPMEHCTLDKDGVYQCNFCSYNTSRKIIMFNHVIIHTIHKPKVAKCPMCPKKFTETVLAVHMSKVHNPEGIFTCPKCRYVTKWKSNLRRHFRLNKDKDKCDPVQTRKTSIEKKKSDT